MQNLTSTSSLSYTFSQLWRSTRTRRETPSDWGTESNNKDPSSPTFNPPHSRPSTLTPQHLLTCELDGQDLKTANDCVAKLKRLDTKGRLWAQEMIMETQSGLLLLCDIETKVSSCFEQNTWWQLSGVLPEARLCVLVCWLLLFLHKHTGTFVLLQN